MSPRPRQDVCREWPTPSEVGQVRGGGPGNPDPGQRERRRRGGLARGGCGNPESPEHILMTSIENSTLRGVAQDIQELLGE